MSGGSNGSGLLSRSNSHKGGAGAGPAEGDKKLHPPQKKRLTFSPIYGIIITEKERGYKNER